MIHALQVGLDSGYERVMIIGSDAPTLPAAHVSALLAADADITFGPAEDGGFYAIRPGAFIRRCSTAWSGANRILC